MKRLIMLLALVLVIGGALAQETKEDRRAAKKARKAEKERIALENTEQLRLICATKMWVLEANTLYGRSGASFMLTPNINFVGFDGEFSSIQLSFNDLVGWNGVGGVTLDGKISKMEIKSKEGKPGFTINASVQNRGGGLVTMTFRVSSDGNTRVDMNGSWGEKLGFQGYIVPLSQTSVYKGTPSF